MGLVQAEGLRSVEWELSYKTSMVKADGSALDILKEFYIPALSLSTKYDRVAGYFRSSSLAAASQGFSAFVGRSGKMRLIVGADLDPQDVAAILRGDQKRMENRLMQELQQPESWPESVRNGVTLLSWMIAHGYLDVKVAFRVHRQTGEALSFEDVSDGYVHEKWFILTDEHGNRLYGSGSLNESKTALDLNAENIDIHCDWWGEREKRRVEQSAFAFEQLWQNRVPHMPVISLPDAVRQRLIRFSEGILYPVEIDGSTAAKPVIFPPSVMERLRFAILKDAPQMPGGRYVGMYTAPVEPWPHQEIVIRRLVETWPYSYMLCDEVGLGKTIEAGLAIRSLVLSGLAKRVLIAAPASLTQQWHREMAAKALLPFARAVTTPEDKHVYIHPRKHGEQAENLYEPDLTIVSTGLFSREERRRQLRYAQGYDIVLIDEAHYARRKNPNLGSDKEPEYGYLYKAIQNEIRCNTKSLWLATATPMQIHPIEVYDLLSLTQRVGAFQNDPTLTLKYFSLLGKLRDGASLRKDEWNLFRNNMKRLPYEDMFFYTFLSENTIDGQNRWTMEDFLKRNRDPNNPVDRRHMQRPLFLASPLSRVMLRHTRKLLEEYRVRGELSQKLAFRQIQPLERIEFTSEERKCYDQLEAYCNGLAKQVSANSDSSSRQMMSFLLSFLRLRFASSFYALLETLKRRLVRVEYTLKFHQNCDIETDAEINGYINQPDAFYDDIDDEDVAKSATVALLKNRSEADLLWEKQQLEAMIADIERLPGRPSKMTKLLEILDKREIRGTGRFKQTVVFTRFLDTLHDILKHLQTVKPEARIGIYSGQEAKAYNHREERLVDVDHEDVKALFLRGDLDILLCTDAAAEGLNLQTADTLINYDLGWNPMKIEQRIGRIDRIGQKHDIIYVYNFCYLGSTEEIVYGRLLERLEQANLIVGSQQVSLLPVQPEEFRELEDGSLDFEELFARAKDRIQQQQRTAAGMELTAQEQYQTYKRMIEQMRSEERPVTLADIWESIVTSDHLKALGCKLISDGSDNTYMLNNINGIMNGTCITIDRKAYEESVKSGRDRKHFATYGDPCFHLLLEYFNADSLPPCIRQVKMPLPGVKEAEIVVYVAAIRNNGIPSVALIKGMKDIQHIQLDEARELTDAEIDSIRPEIQKLIQSEIQLISSVERTERENRDAADLHLRFVKQVSANLLRDGRFVIKEDRFWPFIDELERRYVGREIIETSILSSSFKLREAMLLFDVSIPQMGDRAFVRTTPLLRELAFSEARRTAESLHVKKSELTLEAVVNRLDRRG